MKRRTWLWLLPLVLPPLLCCAGLLILLFDFPGQRVLYETSLDGHSIRFVRQPRKDPFDKIYMTGGIAVDGQAISGPFWMGSLYSGQLEFSEYRYPEDGVLLVYDREMPESILAAIDLKNGLIWPDTRQSDESYAIGRELIEKVNQRHQTNFHIADFHCVKRWKFE